MRNSYFALARFVVSFSLIYPVICTTTFAGTFAPTPEQYATMSQSCEEAGDTFDKDTFGKLKRIRILDTYFYLIGDTYYESALVEAYRAPVARRWTDGVVRFRFTTDVQPEHRSIWRDAVHQWTEDTCVTFLELGADDNETHPELLTVSYSYVSGLSNSSIGAGPSAWMYIQRQHWCTRMIRHEMGHVLGMLHEHQRDDRAGFIDVFEQNCSSRHLPNVKMLCPTVNASAYDFESVMHYSAQQTAINGRDVLRPKPEYMSYYDRMGELPCVSDLDRVAIRREYCMKEAEAGLDAGASTPCSHE